MFLMLELCSKCNGKVSFVPKRHFMKAAWRRKSKPLRILNLGIRPIWALYPRGKSARYLFYMRLCGL
jgi:hypothetical protein